MPFLKAYAPAMKIVGPGSVGEGGFALVPASMPMLQSADLLGTPPKPHFDIFSYHFYGGVSKRCAAMGPTLGTTPDDALSEGWLSRTDSTFDFYKPLHDQYAPATLIWITETGDTACGGNPWAATFLDTFRYVNQMGTRGHAAGITLLAINNSHTKTESISIAVPSERYMLSADTLQSGSVQLNGRVLRLQTNDNLPPLTPKLEPTG